MPILITKSKSVPNQPSKVLVGFCCPLSTGMITERTLLCTIRGSILFGNVPPIIVPLGKDDGDHLTGLQRHFHYVFVGKCHGRKHRTLIDDKNIHNIKLKIKKN
jgi:hypothetical protein